MWLQLITFSVLGMGDDVVAFYGKKGQIKKYSLEKIFPKLKDRSYAEKKFMHSTSSRWWNEDSIMSFNEIDPNLYFCIWVGWAGKWLAWDVRSGKQYDPSPEQKQSWNMKTRNSAIRQFKAGKISTADCKFLSKLKYSQDHKIFEQLLNDPGFGSGSRGGAYWSGSWKRLNADKILTKWDHFKKDDKKSQWEDRYYFLGILKMVIAFPQAPQKNEGVIRVYLIPEQITAEHWSDIVPSQYLIADLSYGVPINDWCKSG